MTNPVVERLDWDVFLENILGVYAADPACYRGEIIHETVDSIVLFGLDTYRFGKLFERAIQSEQPR